jgi:hypothetical protein
VSSSPLENCGEGLFVRNLSKGKGKLGVAKVAAGFVSLLLLGIMTSGALADGDPFAPLTSLTGSTSSSSSSDTTGASSTDATTTDAGTTTDATSSGATTTTAAPAGAPTAYIVTFTAGTSDADQLAEISAAGATAGDPIAALSMYSISFPAGADTDGLAALRTNANVASVDADLSRDTAGAPDDAQYPDQWSLPRIGWDQVYGSVDPAGSATVAILDTGVDASHPDLAGAVVPGTNIITGSGDGESDPNGHGTAMAGIVAAATGNVQGIAGVGYAGVKVMPVTVLDANGLGSDSDVINGVVYATQHGADVILMSFSNPGFSAPLQAAIDYAWSHGVVLVAATGNDGSATVNYPAGDRGVLGVAATDSNDLPASFSNAGADVFLAAPGVNILSTTAGGGYSAISGTSASAAEVAGAAALLKANSLGASNGVIVNRLAANADPVGDSTQTGNGRLNLTRAIGDTSTTSIEPAGAGANGGPFVGPYQAAARNWVLTFAGAGSGSVTITASSGTVNAPVACGGTGTNAASQTVTATCSPNITTSDNAATITLTASPGLGSIFGGWSGAANMSPTTCSGLTNPCTGVFGNGGNGALTVTFNADTTKPTVTINQAIGQNDPTNSPSINFTVVFSEPVTGFTGTDVSLSGTAGATAATVTGSGTTYNVAVSGMTGSGTVIATVPAGTNSPSTVGAQDAAGNGNTASTSTDNTVTFDNVKPTVTINQAIGQNDPTNTPPINFTVVFSEPVTGFVNSDVSLSGTAGATTAAVTGSGTTYNIAVTGMTGSGTGIATVPAGVNSPSTVGAQDAAGNGNTASTSTDNTVNYDVTSPIVTNVTSTNANGTYTTGNSVVVTVTFSELVNVTGAPRLQLETGATDEFANYVSGSGSNTLSFNYLVVSGDAASDLDYLSTSALTLNGGTIKDAATNNATLTLAAPGAAGSLGNAKYIVIDTTSR